MYATLNQYHNIFYSTYTREHYSDKNKLATIIIYDESVSHERDKKEILCSYLKKVPNLVFYFVTYRNQDSELEVIDHMIYVKGVEGFIPGILNKTMLALNYLNKHHEYEYMVRSNISTIVLWDRFPWKEMDGHHYAGTNVLRFIPELPFAQGTNIILSHEAVSFLLSHESMLDKSIIDDVAIAKFILTRYPIYELHDRIRINQERDEGWVYRNRTDGNRDEDTERMKRILGTSV